MHWRVSARHATPLAPVLLTCNYLIPQRLCADTPTHPPACLLTVIRYTEVLDPYPETRNMVLADTIPGMWLLQHLAKMPLGDQVRCLNPALPNVCACHTTFL